MTLSVIVNTFNEGGRVAATCRDFLAAGADEVVVCADGTTDGSCDALPEGARVVRNETPLGCGKSKANATAAASGDVLLWVDAHQNVVSGDLRSMAERALNSGSIFCPAIANTSYDADFNASRLAGSTRLFFPNNTGILPFSSSQYRHDPEQLPMMVGVGLCMSRQTFARVGGWNNFAGRHGSQERGMALRAFMAGVPVVCDGSVVVGHEFFGASHPSRNPSSGQYRFNNIAHSWVNAWHAFYAVSGEPLFTETLFPWMKRSGVGTPAATVEKYLTPTAAAADRSAFAPLRTKTDNDLYVMLRDLSAASPHPLDSKPTAAPVTGMTSFIPLLEKYLDKLKPTSVLEWGPGSSSRFILERLPAGAKLTSIEHDPVWLARAKSAVPAAHAAKWEVILEDKDKQGSTYAWRALSVRAAPQLILVDGRRRVECALAALKAIAPGGAIILHDSNRAAYVDLLRDHITIIDRGDNTLVFTRKGGM